MFSMPVRYDNVRELPYPYMGAVAISSDAEVTSPQMLEWLINYLNDDLGLEFAASIFFYSDTPLHVSYFDSLLPTAKETEYVSMIRDYIKDGRIDTNHAFGDFNEKELCTRENALRVYEMLEKYGLKIPIWTNHGNGSELAMSHNVGFMPFHHGSDSRSPFYHTDLFRAGGGALYMDRWLAY